MRWQKWTALTSVAVVIAIVAIVKFFPRDKVEPEALPSTVELPVLSESEIVDPLAVPAQPTLEQREETIAKAQGLLMPSQSPPLTYVSVQSNFSECDLPVLYELLSNQAYIDAWARMTVIIGLQGNADKAVPILIEYLERNDSFLGPNSGRHYFGKATVLEDLGFLGGSLAEETLRKAITYQGSRDLAAAWLDEAPAEQGDFTVHMRARAARGLILTQKPANNTVVEDEYTRLIPEIRRLDALYENVRRERFNLPRRERDRLRLFIELAWALGLRDYIDEKGLDAYKEVRFQEGRLFPYSLKYDFLYKE